MSKDKRIEFIEIIQQNRKLEIELFWQRSLYFWGFIAATFLAYSQVKTTEASSNNLLLVVITCFGLICSIGWTLANRGSKYWTQVWEERAEEEAEAYFKRDDLYEARDVRKEPWFTQRFSVTKLTIMVSDFVSVLWFALALREVFTLLIHQTAILNRIPFEYSAYAGFPTVCCSCLIMSLTVNYVFYYFVNLGRGRSRKKDRSIPSKQLRDGNEAE